MRHISVVAVVLLIATLSGCSRDPEVLKMEYLASGDRFASEKKYPEAIIQYKNAIAQDPRFGDARFKLANVLAATGDFVGAFGEYVRAADVMPKNARAQLLVGQYLLLGKQYPEAKARAALVLDNDP